MTVTVLDLPVYLRPNEPVIFIKYPVTKKKSTRFFLSNLCPQSGGGGGSDGPCEDDRPDTGMLYPRG